MYRLLAADSLSPSSRATSALFKSSKCLLDHVRGIDSPFQAAVQSQRHHAPQAVAMRRQHRGPCRVVSSGRSL
jgi:hypothetical protein